MPRLSLIAKIVEKLRVKYPNADPMIVKSGGKYTVELYDKTTRKRLK